MSKFRDADIFGGSGGETATTFRDADIFKPVEPEKPAPKFEAKPKERTFGDYVSDRAKSLPTNLARGYLTGGALGLAGAGVQEASQTIGDAIEKVAYNAGGAVTDLTGSPLAGYGANVVTQAVPTVLSGRAAQTAAPMLDSAARRIMQMATKPTWEAQRTGKAANAIDTMLKEGVNPTESGVATLRSRIDDLNNEIKSRIASSDGTVYVGDVDNTLLARLDDFKKQVNPNADIKALRDSWDEFRAHPLISGNPNIPVQTAQELKQGTYRSLGSKPYGEVQGASVEAQKTLARGLKEGVAKAVPEVADLNKRESALLNAAEIAERRALMAGNNQLVGLGWMNPLTLPLWLAERSPTLGGLMARTLYQGQNAIPNAAGAYAAGNVMANQGLAPGERPMLDLPLIMQILQGGPALDPAGEGALYSPPQRGAPKGRLGGGSR